MGSLEHPAPPSVHPHIRGAYYTVLLCLFRLLRFIPTYVGHTFTVMWAPPSLLRFIPTYVGHTTPVKLSTSRFAVHPHIRGAYVGLRIPASTFFRFIPTYVGHTPSHSKSTIVSSVHPHIRGAYGIIAIVIPIDAVHPHIRGAYFWGFDLAGNDARFIPTYVGHTAGSPTKRCDKLGSSPHTWGILLGQPHGLSFGRFIPTYVGHTPWLVTVWPLLCGSSPHTWGIRLTGFCVFSATRFIPTYVGHTLLPPYPQRLHAVHPHIRGAYLRRQHHEKTGKGSSPHTWGIRQAKGIAKPSNPVHPHIRGAYKEKRNGKRRCLGSSPHTWGILVNEPGLYALVRFIPTYVGHTLDRRKKNGWFQPLLL